MTLRRTILAALSATVLLLAARALPAPPPTQENAAREPACVFLVRHAEKARGEGVDARDPELSDAGRARADELARTLAGAGVTQLYSTELRRTRDTLAPLAAALGLEVEVVGARETARQLEALRALPPGAVAVVAGHSNTVPAMASALGAELSGTEEHPRFGATLPDDEYDRLVLVVLPTVEGAAPRAVELRYGAHE